MIAYQNCHSSALKDAPKEPLTCHFWSPCPVHRIRLYSHFRPEKFPPDIVMFTGTLSLKEFKEERPLEYERLVKEDKLDDFLVEPPTEKLVRYSTILGYTLIVIGLVILVLVLSGFVQSLLFA